MEILKFYDNNIENLQKDMKKLEDFKNIIENTNLVDFKDNIDKEKICILLLSYFETILSELPKSNNF